MYIPSRSLIEALQTLNSPPVVSLKIRFKYGVEGPMLFVGIRELQSSGSRELGAQVRTIWFGV